MSHLIFKCVMIIVKFSIRIASHIRNFSLFKETSSNSMSSSGSHNPSCSNDNTRLTVKCMKKTVRLLSLPFLKIKEELNEEQIELLQRELSEEKMRRVCIICHDRERNVLLYPCRHMIMCEECTIALQENYRDCPLCRHEILNTLVVYT
ncbi:hypothetical protein AVEN_87805-1 [Araneus ventricosus]|uniref:RING-type domain-containing protein n=1 Tax=Araneus ventricosus TaxID=182803 RepID=A0A4Y2BDT2_ARAVE|nr:hypothetical protein AVEN_87805-1 [Araneus ventricosus]